MIDEQNKISRYQIHLSGAIQGVGFRPFVYRLAADLNLTGWVQNSPQGVEIEVEGAVLNLNEFLLQLHSEKPSHAFIQSLEYTVLDPAGAGQFEIRESSHSGKKTVTLIPDIAPCPACLREIQDPNDRRYLYPFTNCTYCGPRFSIIEKIPYDRHNTSMKKFTMCPLCQAEYDNPNNRRFHAQPNACPECGPHIELWGAAGSLIASNHDALLQTAEALCEGLIVAVKGVGGFHLMADARNEEALRRLRRRKNREEKPLALMFPGLEILKTVARVNELEERLLASPEAPIVLLERKDQTGWIAPAVAPGNPNLGAMLPSSPLHFLLMKELGFPVVATSGNLTNEPICIDEVESLMRLSGIADRFLVHNRPILRPVDDAILRVVLGRELMLRRGRGYAPLPIHLKTPLKPVLAMGAHLKNTVAASKGSELYVSQHIGDLETPQAVRSFTRTVEDWNRLYDFMPNRFACDLHPDYYSTIYAKRHYPETQQVQHHYAHILACMTENQLSDPVLGVAWDGTGYGPDGTIWGGEFLRATLGSFHRAAHFRLFPLPGADSAVKEPRRTALGLLYEMCGSSLFDQKELHPLQAFSEQEKMILKEMLEKDLRAPRTSSAGRLFDAAASLIGLRQTVSFEGQAAMEMEFAASGEAPLSSYSFKITEGKTLVIDWEPMVYELLSDLQMGLPREVMAAKFHQMLIKSLVEIARRIGEKKVVLSGGCFQNKILTTGAVEKLREAGFQPYWHQRIPPNDGGIALGQAVAAGI